MGFELWQGFYVLSILIQKWYLVLLIYIQNQVQGLGRDLVWWEAKIIADPVVFGWKAHVFVLHFYFFVK